MNNIGIAFIFISVVSLAFFLVLSFNNYRVRFRAKYDVRNHFPYELNYESPFKENLLGNIFAIGMALGGMLLYAMFDMKHQSGYYIFVMIAGMINTLIILSLTFVPLKALKAHLALIALNIIFSFLIAFSLAMQSANVYNATKDNLAIVFIILNTIPCLFVFALIINPKLTKWAEMEKKENEDGSVSYVRPRIFILAFTEWLLLFLNIILEILTLLTYMLVN